MRHAIPKGLKLKLNHIYEVKVHDRTWLSTDAHKYANVLSVDLGCCWWHSGWQGASHNAEIKPVSNRFVVG
jgi:hypothetical protein